MKGARIIKELIDKTGMNLKTFAEEKAGIPYTTLYSILKRGVGKASVNNVIKICRALGITVEELEDMAERNDHDMSHNPDNITPAAPRTDGYDTDLPPEAQEELNSYIEFLKMKYHKKKG